MSTEQLSLDDALKTAASSTAPVDDVVEIETQADLRQRTAEHAPDVTAEHLPALPVESIEWKTSTRM